MPDNVSVSITISSSAVQSPGFGTPLILPATVPAAFTERVRTYTQPSSMITDGFLTTDQAYLEALSICSQRPRPQEFKVGRRATAVAQIQLFVVPASPSNSTLYRFVINGTNCDYTSDGSATQAEVQAGLIAAINAAVGSAVTATTSTNDVLVTAATAGIPFTYSIATGPASPLTLPAQTRLIVIPASPDNAALYTVRINGTPCSYTTDGSATQAELQAGILAAINANVGSAVTATTATNDVLVTADVAGTNFTIEVVDTSTTSDITLGTATGARTNVGIAEDLAAIVDYDADWYGLIITQRDDEHIRVAAQQIEAMRRVFFAQSSDTAIIDLAYNPADTSLNIAAELKGLGYLRTYVWFNEDDTQGLASGWGGQMLARVPGSATGKFKPVAGVTPFQFTTTQKANLLSHNANGYTTDRGRSYTFEGTSAEGEWFDVIHGIDKLTSRIEDLVFGAQLEEDKIPYTQKGLEQIAGLVGIALRESTTEKVIADARTLPSGKAESPAWSITVPAIQDIPSATKETRQVTSSYPITFEATLAGAIHFVTVTGTVTF